MAWSDVILGCINIQDLELLMWTPTTRRRSSCSSLQGEADTTDYERAVLSPLMPLPLRALFPFIAKPVADHAYTHDRVKDVEVTIKSAWAFLYAAPSSSSSDASRDHNDLLDER